jgi:hypothetical protein
VTKDYPYLDSILGDALYVVAIIVLLYYIRSKVTLYGFYLQNSTPMRHKATHFFNVPHYANKVFEFFIALLSDKLKNRIMVSEKSMKLNPFQ